MCFFGVLLTTALSEASVPPAPTMVEPDTVTAADRWGVELLVDSAGLLLAVATMSTDLRSAKPCDWGAAS